MATLKTVSIVLKPLEFVLLVVGMGCVAHFIKESHDEDTSFDYTIDPYDIGYYGRYEFFLYTTGVGAVIVVLGFGCAIVGLLEKKHGALAMCAVQATWTLQLLVSTALLAKILTTFQKELRDVSSVCDRFDKRDYTCGQIIGGVVCGFLAMIVFAVDTVISFKLCIVKPAAEQSNAMLTDNNEV